MQMLKVGITGGMGSGKTVVCRVFETLGIPVYYADVEAKNLINSDRAIKEQLLQLFKEDIYRAGIYNRKRVAELIFNDPQLREQMNSIIHPRVIAHSAQWMQQQRRVAYVLKEAALLFESGSAASLDYIVGVTATQDVRVQRIMARDGLKLEDILKRMDNQMDEIEKMKKCDYVIDNGGVLAIIPQIIALHNKLCNSKFQKNI